MPKASGIVGIVNERPGKYGPMFSIKLEGDETWYGTKSTKPEVNNGDTIEFNFSVNPRGYSDADVNSISVIEAAPEPAASTPETAAAPAATAGRVAFDRKQSVIVYQSSRKDALALIALAASQALIDFPKKGTVADNFNALRMFVDEATNDYYHAAMSVYEGNIPGED